jgi:hypothetical protein
VQNWKFRHDLQSVSAGTGADKYSAKIARASRAHLEAGRFRREAIEDLGEADHMTLL